MALTPDTPWAVHTIVPRTVANGPGLRFGIWVQGCSLGCAGCFNPETHEVASAGASSRSVWTALAKALPLDGVTITGGEPLDQPQALLAFLTSLRREQATAGLGVVVLTGYTVAEIQGDSARLAAVGLADTVVAGRYNQQLRLAEGLRGSTNKQYWHVTSRYADADLAATPEVEVLISPAGDVIITGMHDMGWMDVS